MVNVVCVSLSCKWMQGRGERGATRSCVKMRPFGPMCEALHTYITEQVTSTGIWREVQQRDWRRDRGNRKK